MGIPAEVQTLLHGERGKVRIALVGATEVTHKFGSIILQDLVRKGFDVVPVSPSRAEVHGRRAFATVAEVPGPVHIVDFVVPPPVALEALERLGPHANAVLWFQPGAFDRRVVQAAEAHGGTVIAGPCIMVEAR
jgi:predicted CoA-binding protein